MEDLASASTSSKPGRPHTRAHGNPSMDLQSPTIPATNCFTFLVSSISRIFNCFHHPSEVPDFNPMDRSMEGTSASLPPIHHNQNAAASTTRYQVFINHRGPDVKSTLADLIYDRLHEKGLQVFLDKDEFQPGQPLNPTIEEAIKTSSVHIAIFSKRYAESDWCLKELRLMLETGAPIIPVFYEVQPSDLRWIEQGKGNYVSAFADHEKKGRFDSQTISAWKSALNKVSYISGLDFCQGSWGQFFRSLEDAVFEKLKPVLLDVATHPVGLDEAIGEFESFIESQQKNDNKEVKIVGIVGLGGSGKTTLAKEFFNRKRSSFQKSCFLFDVRASSSLASLQNKLLQHFLPNNNCKIDNVNEGKGIIRERLQPLISSLRVFIILDDIDNEDQIEALRVKDILGSDSLIIITSRDEKPLQLSEASVYKINPLRYNHAKQLFCNNAFKQPFPMVGFEDLVQKFCEKCGGLPLFLKVIGAHLRVIAKNDKKQWENVLKFIPARFVPDQISKVLNVTYTALNPEGKDIFLDIACFFLGEDRDLAIKVWDTCEGNSSIELDTLMNKCLVELDGNNCFKMHDLLRDFGREIANKETPCRLWNENQTADLRRQRKSKKDLREFRGIIAATVDSDYYKPLLEEIELSELKILAIRGDYIDEQIGGNLENLVWFRWFECPYPNIPRWLSSMKDLTVLELFEAKIEEWPLHGEQVRLRELRLVGTNLISISLPGSVCPCLEHLDLSSNYELMEVNYLPPTLLEMNFQLCEKLEHIQDLEHLPQLRALNLSGCSQLRELPALGHLLSLETIDVSHCTSLQHIQSLENLPQLQALNLSWCSELRELPALRHLLSLETIDVSHCTNLQHIQALDNLPQLRTLNLYWCNELRELPALQHLLSLDTLDVGGCTKLQHIQALENLPQLRELNLFCHWKLPVVPALQNLILLKTLDVSGCANLQRAQALEHLPQLPTLNLWGCSELRELPALRHLISLETLDVSGCANLQRIQALEHLPQLRALNLAGCSELRELPALEHLLSLETLDVSGCSNLQHIQALEHLPQLRALNLAGCSELRELPALGHLLSLEALDVSGCSTLQHIQALEHLPRLRALKLFSCSELRELPALGHLLSLETLDVCGCSNLQHIQVLEHLPRLRVLNISGCPKLQQIANLARLISLEDVEADGCWKLQGIQGLDQLEILESLTLSTANSRAIWNATGHMEKLPRRMCLSARAPGNFLHIDARYFNIANLPAVDLNTPKRMHVWQLRSWGKENPLTSFLLSFVLQFPRAQFRQRLDLTIVDKNGRRVVRWQMRVEAGEWLYAICLRERNITRFSRSLHTAPFSIRVEGCHEHDRGCEVKSGWMATGGEEEILEAVKKLFVP